MASAPCVLERLLDYEERVCATYFPIHFRPAHPLSRESFSAQFETVELEQLEMTEAIVRSRAIGERSAEDAERRGPDHFVLNLVGDGHVRQTQYGRMTETPTGFMSLLHSRGPLETEQLTSTRALYVRIPGDMLRAAIGNPENYCAIAYDTRSGMGSLVADHLRTMWRERERLSAHERSALASSFATLVAAFLTSRGHAGSEPHRNESLVRALQFIDANLHDPDLSPSAVAEAIGLSTGHLHGLARKEGVTVGRTIYERRLQRCHAALSNPHNRQRIIEIAFDNGFNDAAHFSRLFKARFGLSPRELRSA